MFKNVFTYFLVVALFPLGNVLAQAVEAESDKTWYSFKEAGEKAAEDGKIILIFGQAEWCPYCRKMLREVYSDSVIQKTISEYFYPVELDVDSDDMVYFNGTEVEEQKLAAYLKLQSLPTHYFMTSDWVIFGQQPGFIPKETFRLMLEYVGTGSHSTMDFQQFIDSVE